MSDGGFWPTTGERTWHHYAIASPFVALLIWFPFVRSSRVPLLGWLDLAIHEFGHIITIPLPYEVTLAMGNGTQLLLPLALAAGFWFASKDPLGAALALAWASGSAQDASRYIADAPFQDLQLIGGVHDWGTLLGPSHLDRLRSADTIARAVWAFGLLLAVAAVLMLATFACKSWLTRDDRPAPTGPALIPTTADDGWSVRLDR